MPPEPNNGIEALNRPLTLEEKDLLRWLLEHGFPGAEKLLPQIEKLTVVGKCTCGCPTVYFALDGVPVKRKGEKVISDYLALVDEMPVGVMVFETDGNLSSLEAYSCPGSDKPFGLPAINSIHGFDN
jgi:hypothetical protein